MVESPTSEIIEALSDFQTCDALALLLGVICKREGLDFKIGPVTCHQRINRLYRYSYPIIVLWSIYLIMQLYSRWAAHEKKWSIVRYTASLGQKLVDSLAPAITAVLIKGRQITLGVFGHEEVKL